MADVWIDTYSGTWGMATGLVIVKDVDDELLDKLDNATDSEIIEVGHLRGTRVSTRSRTHLGR